MGPANPDHVYAVPAVIREDSRSEERLSRVSGGSDLNVGGVGDEGSISRMRKEFEMKEEFLNRPIAAFHPAAQIPNQNAIPQDGAFGQPQRSVPVEVHSPSFQHRGKTRLSLFLMVLQRVSIS